MKTKKILHILALAVLGAASASAAHAAPLPLQNAVITATYNGAAGGMLGLDHDFSATVPGWNTTMLDPTETGVEFFTADGLFGIDFASSGELTIYANDLISPDFYSMQFDFGSSLAGQISAFTLVGSSGVSGVPGLSIIDGHTIALDLRGMAWGQFDSVTARIAVPEPATPAIMLAGVAGLALARRKRRPRA